MQLELEIGDDAEIAAAAANGPEQVGFIVGVDSADLTVGRDDCRGQDIIDGQSVFPIQTAETGAQREAADARVRNDACRGYEPFLE